MGLLALGTAYEWDEAKKYADHVRQHGIVQFLNVWRRLKDRVGDRLLWGDEIEYVVVSMDHEKKEARLSLRQSEILAELQEEQAKSAGKLDNMGIVMPTFHPEYGRYMLESTPGAPYGPSLPDLLSVEADMRYRRRLAKAKLKDYELPITYTSFPRLGAPGTFLDPHHEPDGPASQSLFLPDQLINPHIRFPTLTANIRRRRGSKVAMNVPIYHDTHTPRPFHDPTIPRRSLFPCDAEAFSGAAKPDHIYMDAMGFGMGCCCLQITFQACSIEEARRVYDALVPVGPIMMALSAAAPVFRGYLADVDCRWDVIAGAVDDRTEEERGLKPLKEARFRMPKSRYDSVSLYISEDAMHRPEYNDIDAPFDAELKQKLMDGGIDDRLAHHISHLFIRDPLVIFSETLDQDDEVETDHFENIQSTNWQSIRFKPPPSNSKIGWRVEFRSMEVQLTDFENAAYAIFIVLLTRAILSFGLNFYLPISKVDENMARAQKRDACRTGKFWFRKQVFHKPTGHVLHHLLRKHQHQQDTNGRSDHSTPASPTRRTFPATASRDSSRGGRSANGSGRATPQASGPIEEEYEEMTMDEIINGKSGGREGDGVDAALQGKGFPGLMGLVQAYLESLNVDIETKIALNRYLDLIRDRANGKLITTATYIRRFIDSHPAYKHDSVVSSEVTYDLTVAVDEIERGTRKAEEMLGKGYVGSKDVGTEQVLGEMSST